METTYNEMSSYAKIFFRRLKQYLDTPLYFYGSIQRYDYFPEAADIDVDIFTDNMSNTISRLSQFLKVSQSHFHPFVYSHTGSGQIIRGYKVKYKDATHSFAVEMSIYDEKYKNIVLAEHRRKMDLPIHIICMLVILKWLYYRWQILPKEVFAWIKRFCLNYMLDGKMTEFIITDVPRDKTMDNLEEVAASLLNGQGT